MEYQGYNPNDVAVKNGQLYGLPFGKEDSQLVIVPVPWDVTTSYGGGAANGPAQILEASYQIDLFHPRFRDVWKKGIFLEEIDKNWAAESEVLRKLAKDYIAFIEAGGDPLESSDWQESLGRINAASKELNDQVEKRISELLQQGKTPALLGGDHSTPLGAIRAFSKKYPKLSVLQIDAHADLRECYEGFVYSHASVMYNVLLETSVSRLVQVGIRDLCDEEAEMVEQDKRVCCFYDRDLKAGQFQGKTWKEQVEEIVSQLSDQVYISFDIDGLQPELCPNTGTPVPGGLTFEQAAYLIENVVTSGKKLVGFDLNEVSNGDSESEWDANVGMRMLYELCCAALTV